MKAPGRGRRRPARVDPGGCPAGPAGAEASGVGRARCPYRANLQPPGTSRRTRGVQGRLESPSAAGWSTSVPATRSPLPMGGGESARSGLTVCPFRSPGSVDRLEVVLLPEVDHLDPDGPSLAHRVGKWIPHQTRASTISSIAWENRVKLRVVPDTTLVALKSIRLLPKNCCRVRTIEPDNPLCPDGCSGYGGVLISGSHAGSGVVAGLPSSAASLDRGDRPPEQPMRLVVPNRDDRVGRRGVQHGEHAGVVDDRQTLGRRDLPEDPAPHRHGVLRPEPGGVGLVGGRRGAGQRPVGLDFGEVDRVPPAGEG